MRPTEGTPIPNWKINSISRGKMKTMAVLLDDPNPIHFDVEALQAIGMGDRPVNQGPSNLAYIMNMLAAWTGSHAHLRRIAVRFQANVLAEDEVVAEGVVTGVVREDDRFLADCDVSLKLADGTVALSGTARVDVTEFPRD